MTRDQTTHSAVVGTEAAACGLGEALRRALARRRWLCMDATYPVPICDATCPEDLFDFVDAVVNGKRSAGHVPAGRR